MRERTQLESSIKGFSQLESELNDTCELLAMAVEEGDATIEAEAEEALADLRSRAAKKQLEGLLSGEADGNDCYLEVHAGAGGTEAQDWAEMILRMYLRWSEDHDYKVEWIEESAGEEAGLKSATIKVSGHNAYGWLKTESGVHRLVRISPYDSASRRHTSFASVGVFPVIDESIDIEILDKDMRVDTYRASGAGGQHVNKTDSAVRLTHIPTGIVVQCRSAALDMLRARLYEVELQKREEAAQADRDSKTEIGWGHQIRSYVLHPYQMVKDLRTGVETGNTQAVLDGGIDEFLEATLSGQLKSDKGEEKEAAG